MAHATVQQGAAVFAAQFDKELGEGVGLVFKRGGRNSFSALIAQLLQARIDVQHGIAFAQCQGAGKLDAEALCTPASFVNGGCSDRHVEAAAPTVAADAVEEVFEFYLDRMRLVARSAVLHAPALKLNGRRRVETVLRSNAQACLSLAALPPRLNRPDAVVVFFGRRTGGEKERSVRRVSGRVDHRSEHTNPSQQKSDLRHQNPAL